MTRVPLGADHSGYPTEGTHHLSLKPSGSLHVPPSPRYSSGSRMKHKAPGLILFQSAPPTAADLFSPFVYQPRHWSGPNISQQILRSQCTKTSCENKALNKKYILKKHTDDRVPARCWGYMATIVGSWLPSLVRKTPMSKCLLDETPEDVAFQMGRGF